MVRASIRASVRAAGQSNDDVIVPFDQKLVTVGENSSRLLP